jgi:hypothetical protein
VWLKIPVHIARICCIKKLREKSLNAKNWEADNIGCRKTSA